MQSYDMSFCLFDKKIYSERSHKCNYEIYEFFNFFRQTKIMYKVEMKIFIVENTVSIGLHII